MFLPDSRQLSLTNIRRAPDSLTGLAFPILVPNQLYGKMDEWLKFQRTRAAFYLDDREELNGAKDINCEILGR